jgi:hypothetical protein
MGGRDYGSARPLHIRSRARAGAHESAVSSIVALQNTRRAGRVLYIHHITRPAVEHSSTDASRGRPPLPPPCSRVQGGRVLWVSAQRELRAMQPRGAAREAANRASENTDVNLPLRPLPPPSLLLSSQRPPSMYKAIPYYSRASL